MISNSCTFFGHRDTPSNIRPLLHSVLTELIEKNKVNTFFVGNQGSFDSMVRQEMEMLTKSYPQIKYSVVLAYMPQKRCDYDLFDYSDTIFPSELENVPRKFAIDKRNRLMLRWSDIVVTYVCYYGGAEKYKEIAVKRGKKVIELSSLPITNHPAKCDEIITKNEQ